MERKKVIHDILDRVRGLDVTGREFYAVFAVMAYKMIKQREITEGVLPKGLFLKMVELSGSYLCTEVILISPNGNPILKIREDETARAGELGWENKLHIPGIAVRNRRAEDMLPTLLVKEVVKNPSDAQRLSDKKELIGFGRLDEPERKTIADTCYFGIRLTDTEMSLLQSGFCEVDVNGFTLTNGVLANNQTAVIIDQHKPVLRWWKQGENREPVFDTRLKK